MSPEARRATIIDAAPVAAPPPAGVAQLVEQLIRNQQVTRSSRVAGSNKINNLPGIVKSRSRRSYHIATTRRNSRYENGVR
jgi:hypothetical protein